MIVRTGYSFKNAIGKLTDVIGRLKELGVSRFAVADTNSTYSFTRLTKLCEGNSLNLVYGVELGVSPNPEGKKPSVDKWIFLAKSSLRPLHELVYKGTILPTRDPAITYKCAVEAQDLFKIMGPMTMLESLDEVAPEPRADLFLGLSAAVPRALVRRLLDRGHQPVALPNNRYPRAADLELYRITLGSSKPGKGSASTQTYPQHILSDDEWCNELSWLPGDVLGQALVNRDRILLDCNASIQKAELLVPEKPKNLLDMCQEGALSLGIDLNDQVYSDRLSRELDLIQHKKFEDYFYIVADMMQEARKHMIVGPARGSSGGSLVCYLLGITSVDPIRYDLVFERFIDVTRSDLPDIDVDLSDDNRHLIFEYMEKKYGRNRVARLGSVNTFKARAVLNIVGSALKIAPWHIRDLETALIKRPDGDPRVGNVIEDTFKETFAGQEFLRKSPESRIAERIEDHPAAAAQHAAGVILTDKPIFEYVGVNGNTRASMCDKRDAEALNLLKIDALGLSQLSVFERCLKAIGKDEEGNKFIESIPIDEQDALNVLNDMKYSGIFQFVPGTAVNAYVQKLREIGGRIDSVEDICAMTALVRPGPLGSGATDSWIYRKAGIEKIRYAHPSLEPILNKTMGVITYQEQILNMGREVAGMSWEDVTGVRKAIAKKMGSVFAEYGEKWREGAHAISGIPYELADKIWEELKEHGSYSFNRCISGEETIELQSFNKWVPVQKVMKISDLWRIYEEEFPGFKKPVIISLIDDGGLPQRIKHIYNNGYRRCLRFSFDDGSSVVCTPEHKFIVNGEWQQAKKSIPGDKWTAVEYKKKNFNNGRGKGHSKGKHWGDVRSSGRTGETNPAWINGKRAAIEAFKVSMKGLNCEDCNSIHNRMEVHHNDFSNGDNRPEDLSWLCPGCHKKRHYKYGRTRKGKKPQEIFYKILVSVTSAGIQETFDIEMENIPNFKLSNGLITHNSHAMAYALTSYHCCWLKWKYPLEFAAATLDSYSEPHSLIQILRELRDEGVSYIPIDINHSIDHWSIINVDGKRTLLGPVQMVDGVGSKSVIEAIKCRKDGKPIEGALGKRLTRATTAISSLDPVRDAFRSIDLKAKNVVSEPQPVSEIQLGDRDVCVFVLVEKVKQTDENDPIIVKKRGGWLKNGDTIAVQGWIRDDTQKIFFKIDCENSTMVKSFIETARPGKSLYAMKGFVPPTFRMLKVTGFRYVGEFDNKGEMK